MRYRYVQITLLALIAARLLVSVASGAGYYWDFVNFYNTGARMVHGEVDNLYRASAPIAGEAPLGSSRFEYVGFPLSAYVFAPLGVLPPRAALLAFKAAAAACFALGLIILYRYCRDRFAGWRSDVALCLYLLLILLFEPLWFVFAIGGQATPLIFLLLVLLLWSYTADRLWVSALCLSVATLIKPLLGLMVLIFLMAGDWQLLTRLGGCFAFEGALSWLIFGWERHVEWVRIVLKESSRWAVPWWNNCSILGFFGNFWLYTDEPQFGLTPVPRVFSEVQAVFHLLLIVGFLWMVSRLRRRAGVAENKRQCFVLLAILFPLFFSTIVWPHYLAFALIPLLLFAAQYSRLPAFGRLLIGAAFVSTLRANLWPVTTFLQRVLTIDTPLATFAISLLASGTLILTLILALVYHQYLLRTESVGQA